MTPATPATAGVSSSSSNPSDSVQTLDVDSLKNSEEMRAAFRQLSKEEERVDSELESLLSRQVYLESRLRSLSSSSQALQSTGADAEKLASVISFTAGLAEGVSIKVKQLDLAKSRVSECQQRVNDLIDLKLCSDGVQTALAEEDYEQAAAHVHRFLDMDEGLLKLTATEMSGEGAVEGGVSSLEHALKTLHKAETKVRAIVSGRFDEAVKKEDLASIERFFKIFPLINMHEEGLKKFTLYLCSKVAQASKSNLMQAVDTPSNDPRANVIFADTITLLFEGIARTVEIHQPLVETYYGLGRLLNVVTMLQEECDKQADRILSEFRRKRGVRDKVSRVREAMYGSAGTSGAANKIAAKDLDHVLNEMILLQARAEMYNKFVRKRVLTDMEVAAPSSGSEDRVASLDRLLSRSALCHAMQDLLADYILLEDYFMTENVQTALQASNSYAADGLSGAEGNEDENRLLDDVFFLLKKCVRRAAEGHNVDGACAVLNNACRILEQDLCGLLQVRLKMGFPTGYLDLTHAYNVLHSSYQQGKLQAGDTERQKQTFLTALNNADSAVDYISRLASALQSDVDALVANRSEHEKDKLENCLQGLPAAADKLKSVLDQGIQQLRQSAVKPRIKPWMDSFVSHDVNEEQFAEFEANDPFVQTLTLNLDSLLTGFKRSLTNNNFEALVAILTAEVTAQLEKAVLKSA